VLDRPPKRRTGRRAAPAAAPSRTGEVVSRSRTGEVDARIAAIAGRQHGVISRRQLADDVGMLDGAINRRLASGRLVPVHPGVYRVAGPQATLATAMAAVLAGGRGTVLSGRSAAAIHGVETRHSKVEITTTGKRRLNGVAYSLVQLPPRDVTVHLGLPVTSLARTVYDLAGRPDYADRRLARLVNRARLIRPSILTELDELVVRLRGQGRSRLAERRLQPHLADPNGPIRSVFEERFRRAVERSDLPVPRFNVRIAGFEVDVLWREAMLVVELDGRFYHAGADHFENDRLRDAELVALHYQVIRITWGRWSRDHAAELDRLRSVISDRAAGDGRSGGT
jgi:very-short-patch-repair endonuclease